MTEFATPDRSGTTAAQAAEPPHPRDTLRDALFDSRQRWRDLVSLGADLAFETDVWGRFVFLMPDPAFGWTAGTLLGQPGSLLLANGTDASTFDPFRPNNPMRRRRAWIKRADGSAACLAFSVTPLTDDEGRITGARGIGIDMTDYDARDAQVAASLRRGEVLDHILWRVGQEVLAPRMMSAALGALLNALGAEGTAVIVVTANAPTAELVHQAGGGAEAVMHAAARLMGTPSTGPLQSTNLDGRPLLLVGCQTRFGSQAGLLA